MRAPLHVLCRPGAGWKHLRPRAGFTLVEVLVVTGVIVVLAGLVAAALGGRGGEGVALANAQKIVAGLVSSARAQAALHQTNARLVVYAQPPGTTTDAAKYLRTVIVLREEPFGSGRYVATGDPVLLPAPICVVPPSPVPATHLNTGVAWNNNAATGPVSTLRRTTGFSYFGSASANTRQFFGTAGRTGTVLDLQFAPDGTVASNPTGNPTKIALATAVLSPSALPRFNNAFGVRGLFVRRTGAVSLVNGATAF